MWQLLCLFVSVLAQTVIVEDPFPSLLTNPMIIQESSLPIRIEGIVETEQDDFYQINLTTSSSLTFRTVGECLFLACPPNIVRLSVVVDGSSAPPVTITDTCQSVSSSGQQFKIRVSADILTRYALIIQKTGVDFGAPTQCTVEQNSYNYRFPPIPPTANDPIDPLQRTYCQEGDETRDSHDLGPFRIPFVIADSRLDWTTRQPDRIRFYIPPDALPISYSFRVMYSSNASSFCQSNQCEGDPGLQIRRMSDNTIISSDDDSFDLCPIIRTSLNPGHYLLEIGLISRLDGSTPKYAIYAEETNSRTFESNCSLDLPICRRDKLPPWIPTHYPYWIGAVVILCIFGGVFLIILLFVLVSLTSAKPKQILCCPCIATWWCCRDIVKHVKDLDLPKREKGEPKMAENAAPVAGASDLIDLEKPKEIHKEVDTASSRSGGSTQVDLSVSTSQK